MLIATQGKSVSGTQRYFDQVLTRGDYYLGQEVAGHWHGRGVEVLGLGAGSQVKKEEFNALLEGKHPTTGKRLTQRNRKDRRPGMDLTFSVPKSVSLAWAINGDERILEMLQAAVQETMQRDVEPLMQRRVRTGRHAFTQQKEATGKLIYADFLHKTSRPVEGAADPHLHIHAFVVNWTEQDGKHYAGEFEEIVRQRPSLQAKFEARLARKMQNELGYAVEHVHYAQGGKLKWGWEVRGVERSTIEKFSRRTAQVEQYAEEHAIHDAERKGMLGKLTREKKDTGQSIDQLRSEWRSRLTPEERAAFAGLLQSTERAEGDSEQTAARDSVQYALEHHLYRQSTVERHQVVGTALEHGLTIRPETVEAEIDRMDLIQRTLDADGTKRQLITTQEVLNAEREMISYARDGRGTRKSIGSADHEFEREWLNDQQRDAVRFVLESRDAVLAVAGGAGTGKSSLMEEAVDAIQMNGKRVFTFAPSTGARDVLEEKGFRDAQTVEHLLRNSKLHDQLKDQVIWIDEAGLLDVRSMNSVFRIASQQNARVVLSGDTRQHASPRRGEAMRLLEQEAGLGVARVEAIQRQQGRYRRAVEMISRGQEVIDARTGKTGLLAGFDLLDAMGKIKEVASEDRYLLLAEKYLKLEALGKSTLVVAPTHREAAAVTTEIRDRLRADGKLAAEERSVIQYRSLNLSEAEKGDIRSYADQTDLVVQFHQNVKGGFQRGERYRVTGVQDGEVKLSSVADGKQATLPRGESGGFEVYAERELRIAAGDKLRFSLGGTTRDGKGRISNGRLDEVKGFDAGGNLVLKNGWVIDPNYAHLDLGYVVTSHASQGKDRHVAIAAMGSESLPAINAKQFYVTVSRGREDVAIYVDDKARVRRAIERSGEQLSATQMLKQATEKDSSSNRKADVAHDHTHERWSPLKNFRDRVMRWWRGHQADVQACEPIGRNRQLDLQNSLGLGMSPGIERSI